MISNSKFLIPKNVITLSKTNSKSYSATLIFALILPLGVFSCVKNSYAASWSGILDPSRAVDWSNAGAAISTTRTQCTTSACNAVTGGTVTTTSLNAAINSAPANTYIQIPTGIFTITDGILVNGVSNITIRGAGSNRTFLIFTGGDSCGGTYADVCVKSTDTNYWGDPSNNATWSAGYAKGNTSIILSSVSNMKVGQPLVLDQIDDVNDTGELFSGCEYPSSSGGGSTCYSGAWPSGYQRGSGSGATIRGQQQIVTVTSCGAVNTPGASCSGTNVTVGISPGLYAPNWRSSQSPGAWWADNPVYNVGVEDISLAHNSDYEGIDFFNAQGCWVKGIRSIRQTTTGTGWTHVGAKIGNKITVKDSYFYGYPNDTYALGSYVASDLLWENNIIQNATAPEVYNSDCEGCVNAYNFSVNDNYPISTNWLSQSITYHSIMLYGLSEGNVGSMLYADTFHGTHDMNTLFRNRLDGKEPNNGNDTTSNTISVRLNPKARYQNVIGNVLGVSGYHNKYEAAPSSSSNQYTSIFSLGIYPETGEDNDPLVGSTLMRWGNYDTVNADVRWQASEVPSGLSKYANAVPSSQTLPASFYLTSKPSWWPSDKAWPAIGPDVIGGNISGLNGHAYTIPAQDCYTNVTGGTIDGVGSPLTFDASVCYASSSDDTTAPSSPSGLSVR
jgi:hypothetical protein